jgi:hypothetical protein
VFEHVVGQRRRSCGHAPAGDAVFVLERHRDALERSGVAAAIALAGSPRRLASSVEVGVGGGVDQMIHRLVAFDLGVEDLDRLDLAGTESLDQFGGAEIAELDRPGIGLIRHGSPCRRFRS